MKVKAKRAYDILSTTVGDFINDDCMTMAAALAYYTMFSLPPLLVLVISLAGTVYDPSAIRGQLQQQAEMLVGAQASGQIETMVEKTQANGSGTLATVLGVVILVAGASSVLAQLQYALNKAWEVEPDPNQGGVKSFLVKRILSLAMIVAIAFLLLVSLVISAALSAFAGVLGRYFTNEYVVPLLHLGNMGVSLVVIMLLFAAMFKILPDAKIPWRHVWTGAFATALLFTAGKGLIGLYLGSTNVGSAYGAAGALAILLLWIYYASLIVLLGAEFTQVWARRHGTTLEPEEGAVRTVRMKRHIRSRRDPALALSKEHREQHSA